MKVLIIAPHADDEVLGTGGVIQWHKEKGDAVYIAVVANRVLGHKIDENYTIQTKKSAERVKKLLGVDKYYFSDMVDEHLDEILIKIIVRIEEVISILNPDTIYIPYEDDANQDHRAVRQACRVACRDINRILEYEVPSSTTHFKPNYYVELKEEFLDNKIKAAGCYESETRAYPNPRSSKGLRVFAQMRGMECGKKLAEAFILVKEVI